MSNDTINLDRRLIGAIERALAAYWLSLELDYDRISRQGGKAQKQIDEIAGTREALEALIKAQKP